MRRSRAPAPLGRGAPHVALHQSRAAASLPFTWRRHSVVTIPPSITMSAPVTLPARLLASSRTRSATSSGRVNRFAATRLGEGRGDALVAQPQGSRDRSGTDGVDADAAWADLLRERLREVREGGLGGGVVDDERVGDRKS